MKRSVLLYFQLLDMIHCLFRVSGNSATKHSETQSWRYFYLYSRLEAIAIRLEAIAITFSSFSLSQMGKQVKAKSAKYIASLPHTVFLAKCSYLLKYFVGRRTTDSLGTRLKHCSYCILTVYCIFRPVYMAHLHRQVKTGRRTLCIFLR